MTPNGQRQRAHRERRATERQRMIDALTEIIDVLQGKQKELSNQLRQIAWNGLGGEYVHPDRRPAAKGEAK